MNLLNSHIAASILLPTSPPKGRIQSHSIPLPSASFKPPKPNTAISSWSFEVNILPLSDLLPRSCSSPSMWTSWKRIIDQTLLFFIWTSPLQKNRDQTSSVWTSHCQDKTSKSFLWLFSWTSWTLLLPMNSQRIPIWPLPPQLLLRGCQAKIPRHPKTYLRK